MLLIRDLSKRIREELEDAEWYAKEAARVKMDDPPLASVYAELAREEMGHAERLHKCAVDLIDRKKAGGVEIPPVMRVLWDHEHKEMIEEMAEVKHILELSRG